MRIERLTLVLLLSLMLTGCTATNVLFANRERGPHPDPEVISIIYDRYGSLYPSPAVDVPESALRMVRSPSQQMFRLSAYFRDQRADRTPAWQALMAEAPVFTPGADTSFDIAWRDVQAVLRNGAVRRIEHLALGRGGTPRPLIVLVHGFNNDKSEALQWYKDARDLVRARHPDAVFLDVHWDGLTANLPPGIWSSAQYNFPLVGLEFRRVLNALDPRIPVRVLTHSSGGPLIASTLGDASCPLVADDEDYRRYYELVRDTANVQNRCSLPAAVARRAWPRHPLPPGEREAYRPPNQPDFRVGMIVPAASPNTFTSFTPNADGPDRLIIGINSEDMAIGKLFLSCNHLGSTCMSARPPAFCQTTREEFRDNPHIRLHLLDFKSPNNKRFLLFWDEHSMVEYLRRDDIRRFLDLLLNDEVSDEGELTQVCGSS
jgi:hypothetical protein